MVIEKREARSVGNYIFVLTCSSCPEQYDVFDVQGVLVGYVRLRYGSLSARCPNHEGCEVYKAAPEGDGSFASDKERNFHLLRIAEAISNYYK